MKPQKSSFGMNFHLGGNIFVSRWNIFGNFPILSKHLRQLLEVVGKFSDYQLAWRRKSYALDYRYTTLVTELISYFKDLLLMRADIAISFSTGDQSVL